MITIAIILLCLCAFALWIFQIAAHWKVFEKAGQPGWACIIPIYNIYIMTKIGGKPGWWTVLIIFLPFIFGIWLINMISKSFGKDEVYTLGLLILGIIFWPILGFGSAKYLGPFGDQATFQRMQNPNFDFDKKS